MTNPDNAVGTSAAYGGRTSVNAFNDGIAAFTRGVLSGWSCVPKSGMTVSIGGDGTTRDVAVAENNTGDKTTINNTSGAAIDVTISAAPGTNTRIDSIVAYVDNPPQGSPTIVDNYESCGLIVVKGTASSSPVAPNENMIRTAITADGASGTTAYYVVLAKITIPHGTTDITGSEIALGSVAQLKKGNMPYVTYANSIVPGASNPWNFVLTRSGNIVVMLINTVQSAAQGAADNVTSGGWNTVPQGFRPVRTSSDSALNGGLCVFTRIAAGGSSPSTGQWRVDPNGVFYLSTLGWTSGVQRLSGTCTWVTNDDFPA